MLAFFVLALIALQVLMAFISPIFLIIFSLLTCAMPLSFASTEMLPTPFGTIDLSAIRLLGLLLSGLIVMTLYSRDTMSYLKRYWIHTLFLLFCFSSTIYAPSMEFAVRMFAKLTGPFVFLIVIMCVIQTKRQLHIMATMVMASGIALVAIAALTKIFGINADPRFSVPNMGPATFSAHVVTVTMLLLASFVVSRRSRFIILFLIMAASVIAAFTRITIGALFIASSAILFFGTKGIVRLLLPILGVIALPALFLFNDRFRARMFIGGDHLSYSQLMAHPDLAVGKLHGSGRFDAWHEILETMFVPNPLFGSGIGATQHYFYTHSVTGLGAIHSEYIRLLAEVGILGLILFTATMLGYAARAYRNIRLTDDADGKIYSHAALAGVIVYLVFISTDNGFDYVTQFGIFVFSFIAMSEKSREFAIERSYRS